MALNEAIVWTEGAQARLAEAKAAKDAAYLAVGHDSGDEAEAAFLAANKDLRNLQAQVDAAAEGVADRLCVLGARSASGADEDAADQQDAGELPAPSAGETFADAEPVDDITPLDPGPIGSGGPPLQAAPVARAPNIEPLVAEPVLTAAKSTSSAPRTSLINISASEPPAAEAPCTAHPEAVGAEAVILAALHRRRLGFAAELAAAAEMLGPSGACVTAPFGGAAALRALAVGEALDLRRLRAVEARFGETVPPVLAALDVAAPQSPIRLLAFAGALKPALFSMQTAAAEVIRARRARRL